MGLTIHEDIGGGTGTDNANYMFTDRRSLSNGTSETLTIYPSTTLVDAFGRSLSFDLVKFFFFRYNPVVGTGRIDLSPGVSNGWDSFFTSTVIIEPNGILMGYNPDGWAVSTTKKTIRIEEVQNLPGDFTYDIVLVGEGT